MPLNAPGKWKYFISYQQTSTIAEAMVIAYELGKDDCWLDRVHTRSDSPLVQRTNSRALRRLSIFYPPRFAL